MEGKKMEREVLLAVDYTKHSRETLNVAIEVCKTLDAELHLIHVIHDFGNREFVVDMKKRLEEWRKVVETSDVKIGSCEIRDGQIKDEVLAYAKEKDIGLIIVGFGNEENVKRNHMGKFARKILRESNRSVFVVKGNCLDPFEKLLCAVDILETSKETLEKAIFLATTLKRPLHVLHIVPEKDNLRLAEKDFDQFFEGIHLGNITVERTVLTGEGPKTISDFATVVRASIILVGESSSGGGILSKLIDTYPEKVIKSTSLPCIILR